MSRLINQLKSTVSSMPMGIKTKKHLAIVWRSLLSKMTKKQMRMIFWLMKHNSNLSSKGLIFHCLESKSLSRTSIRIWGIIVVLSSNYESLKSVWFRVWSPARAVPRNVFWGTRDNLETEAKVPGRGQFMILMLLCLGIFWVLSKIRKRRKLTFLKSIGPFLKTSKMIEVKSSILEGLNLEITIS